MTDWRAPIFGTNTQVRTFFEVASFATGWEFGVGINSSSTLFVIQEADSTNYPITDDPIAGDVLQADDEDMLVSGFNSGTSAATVTRGWGGTSAVSHSTGTGIRHFRDFTDRVIPKGIPTFKTSAEKRLNFNSTVSAKLVVDNRDGQWNNPEWYGTWRGRLVRFYFAAPEESRHGDGASSPAGYMTTLATSLIDDVAVSSETATITLVSIDTVLRRREGQDSATAEKVRDKGWRQNDSAKQLVRTVLAQQFNSTRQAPPEYWMTDISDSMELPVSGSNPKFSHYGRPPEWDGGQKIQTDKITRAIALDTENNRLYYGADEELWYRDLTTNVDTQVSSSVNGEWPIVRLWASTQEPGTIWGVVLESPIREELTQSAGGDLQPEQYMKIFKYTGSGSVTLFDRKTIVSGYWTATELPFANIGAIKIGAIYDELPTLPFAQLIRPTASRAWTDLSSVSTHSAELDDVFETTYSDDISGLSSNGFSVPRGYRHVSLIRLGVPYPLLGVLWSQGQRGAIAYDPDYGSEGAIFFVTKSATTNNHILINKFICSTEAFSAASDTTMEMEQPTAMWAGGGKVFIGTFEFVNTSPIGDEDPSLTRIHRYNSTSLAYEAKTWGDNETKTVLEMVGDNASSTLHWVALDRVDWYTDAQPYTIRQTGYASAGTGSTATATPYGVNAMSSQPCGLTYVADAFSQDYRLWCTTGDGSIMRYNRSAGPWVLAKGGNELVENEPYTTGALAVQANTESDYSVYGVSAPLPSWYTAEGSPDFPVAAAGKYFLWKIDDTIADRYPLADFSNWTLGDALDRIANAQQRNWRFDARGKFQFGELPAPNPVSADYNISTHAEGDGNIYAPWLNPKGPVVSLGYSEIANTATAVPYVVKLQDISKPSMSLSSASALRDVEASALPIIEVSSSAIYPLRVVLRCVRAGKLLHDTPAQRPQFRVITDLPTINLVLTRKSTNGSGLIYVDRIPLNEDGSAMFEWSADANQGDYITVGDREYFEANYRKITSYDVDAGTITVDPVINDTNDPDTNPYPAGTAVVITPRASGINTAQQELTFADGVGQEIVDGITVKMSAGVDDVADETPITEGDSLAIEVPGLKLEKAERSIQTKVNSRSIRKYDKREPRIPDNRLLTKASAFELAVSHVDYYAFPHWQIKGGVWRIMPWLKPMDTIKLTDPMFMKYMPNGYDIMMVQSVTHDTKNGTTTVDLRGLIDIDTDAP